MARRSIAPTSWNIADSSCSKALLPMRSYESLPKVNTKVPILLYIRLFVGSGMPPWWLDRETEGGGRPERHLKVVYVPLDRISGGNHRARALCDRAGALPDLTEHPCAGVDVEHQRRRLRPGLVRPAPRTGPLPRSAPGLV